MPAKNCFFRPKTYFFSLQMDKSFSKTFFHFYTFSFFSSNFKNFIVLTKLAGQRKIFGFPSFMFANSFQGFFTTMFKFINTPSYAILHLKGIGYKCYHAQTSNKLVFNTGFNHYSIFTLPKGIEVKIRKTFFALFSSFGSVKKFVRIIRAIRFPDPYRAKGFRYKNQLIKFKVGKQRLFFLNVFAKMKTLLVFNRQIPLSNLLGPTFRTFYGVSFIASITLCTRFGLRYRAKFSDLLPADIFYLTEIISDFFQPNYKLIRIVVENINYKIRNGSYQGFCILNGLPSRGQRSKTNGKTATKRLPIEFIQSIR